MAAPDCPGCDHETVADVHPQRDGWLWCPACQRPAWMPFCDYWIRVWSEATLERQSQRITDLVVKVLWQRQVPAMFTIPAGARAAVSIIA
jgi:hypothetical protein